MNEGIEVPDSAYSQWQPLASMVDSGHLRLERGVAQRCAQRCVEFVAQLETLKDNAMNLATVDGLGDLQSGTTLAAKFGRKAAGGDYSMDQAIDDHIKVVLEMRQTFEKIEAMYTASDDSGARGISASGAAL